MVTSEGAGHRTGLDDFQGASERGERKREGLCETRWFWFCFFFKWQKPEHAAQGREAEARVNCHRGIDDTTSWRRERMDSKAQVLGLVLKKRRATPPHPRGKEVRERE